MLRLLHFLCICTYVFVIYPGNGNVPESQNCVLLPEGVGAISEQMHQNLHRDY